MDMLIQEAARSLLAADNILILAHIHPDGDTLGSSAALKHALNILGKKCLAYDDDIPTQKYSIISEISTVEDINNFTPEYIVTVDVAGKSMLGEISINFAKNIDLVIDHHITNSLDGKLKLVFPKFAACGEIIYKLILAMGVQINSEIAKCLYTAVATDTGCFRHAHTTAHSHYVACKLFETGIDISALNRRYFETKSKAQFAVEGEVRNQMKLYHDGRLSIFCVTLEMMDRLGATNDDIDGLASISLQLESVEIGIYIRQEEKNEFKISMRSKGGYSVAEICALYGGGGHHNAAGCTIKGNLNDIITELTDRIWMEFSI